MWCFPLVKINFVCLYGYTMVSYRNIYLLRCSVFSSIETCSAGTWLVRLRAFPTAPEGIVGASTHPRLLRLRVAASTLESLYHSVFWGQRYRQTMSHTAHAEPFPGSRGWGRRASRHGCRRRCSSLPRCRASAGWGSVCTDADWSCHGWTLRTGLTETDPSPALSRLSIRCLFSERISGTILHAYGFTGPPPPPPPCLTKTTTGPFCPATKLVSLPGLQWKEPEGKATIHVVVVVVVVPVKRTLTSFNGSYRENKHRLMDVVSSPFPSFLHSLLPSFLSFPSSFYPAV